MDLFDTPLYRMVEGRFFGVNRIQREQTSDYSERAATGQIQVLANDSYLVG